MKFVVDFEKAKTTHTQTRVPARLISGWQRVSKSGCGQGCLAIMSAKEGTQNREAGKAEQTRIIKVQRKCRGIQLRTEQGPGGPTGTTLEGKGTSVGQGLCGVCKTPFIVSPISPTSLCALKSWNLPCSVGVAQKEGTVQLTEGLVSQY